ncbi:MAG: lactate utilization protein [Planctomycetes bacterium]|nr:lactate utilization protein [Planctomycetota bacterium]
MNSEATPEQSKQPRSSRDRILQNVCRQLAGVEVPPLPEEESRRLPQPADVDVLAAQFQRMAEGVSVDFFDDVQSATKGMHRVAVSNGADLPIAVDGVELFEGWNDREGLLTCDAGLTTAQIGIAESGTLGLIGDLEKHRLVSLVPPIHVAMLKRENIVGTMSEALSLVHQGGLPSSLITFVTGPSRTADIELQLVLGVHGPRELRVVLY